MANIGVLLLAIVLHLDLEIPCCEGIDCYCLEIPKGNEGNICGEGMSA